MYSFVCHMSFDGWQFNWTTPIMHQCISDFAKTENISRKIARETEKPSTPQLAAAHDGDDATGQLPRHKRSSHGAKAHRQPLARPCNAAVKDSNG